MDHTVPPLRVVSAVPGMVWPGLPGPSGAALLAILFQLEQTQWWPEDRLRLAQRRQLGVLLAHAREQVPFWRDRLPRDWPDPTDEAAWETAWQSLPVLQRAEIQAAEASEAMLAATLPPGHGEYREILTSGSTGRPIRAVRSQLWELVWSAFTLRDHLWHRRDLSGTLAAIRESGPGKAAYPEGDTAGGWGVSSAALFETGRMVSLNVTTPPAQQLDWLARRNPDYLLSHPSVLARLAAASMEAGLRLPRLRQVIAISETLRPEARATIEAAWGVPVVDVYSSRECGYLALQCPGHPHLHVQSEGLRLEVVHDSGRPCRPGEVGRVLVTPLHNLAMPLIRYDIGDFAEVGPPCPCGRGLPVLKRILGRRQNMLRLPGGDWRWPLLSSGDIGALLAAAPPVRQHQIEQAAMDRLVVRLAVARPLTAAEERAVMDWAQAKFGAGFQVTVEAMPDLPRGPGGKFEDFICRLPGG